jgi:hypothetical protein
MPQQIALYVSDPAVTPELRAQIQHHFDTAPTVGRQNNPRPDYIEFVPGSDTWSIGMSSKDIHEKHSQEYVPRYPRKPIIILDERSAKDSSVLVIALIVDEETDEFKHMETRFVPSRVPDAAMNLEIGNQTLQEVLSFFSEGLVHF